MSKQQYTFNVESALNILKKRKAIEKSNHKMLGDFYKSVYEEYTKPKKIKVGKEEIQQSMKNKLKAIENVIPYFQQIDEIYSKLLNIQLGEGCTLKGIFSVLKNDNCIISNQCEAKLGSDSVDQAINCVETVTFLLYSAKEYLKNALTRVDLNATELTLLKNEKEGKRDLEITDEHEKIDQ